MKDIMTVKELSAYLRIPTQCIYRYISKGTLEAPKENRRRIITKEAVRNFLNRYNQNADYGW